MKLKVTTFFFKHEKTELFNMCKWSVVNTRKMPKGQVFVDCFIQTPYLVCGLQVTRFLPGYYREIIYE